MGGIGRICRSLAFFDSIDDIVVHNGSDVAQTGSSGHVPYTDSRWLPADVACHLLRVTHASAHPRNHKVGRAATASFGTTGREGEL